MGDYAHFTCLDDPVALLGRRHGVRRVMGGVTVISPQLAFFETFSGCIGTCFAEYVGLTCLRRNAVSGFITAIRAKPFILQGLSLRFAYVLSPFFATSAWRVDR